MVAIGIQGIHGCPWMLMAITIVRETDWYPWNSWKLRNPWNPWNLWKSMDRVVSAWRQQTCLFPAFENYRFTKLWTKMHIEALICSPTRRINCRCTSMPGGHETIWNHPVCSELNQFVYPQTNRWCVSKSSDTRHPIFTWLGAILHDFMQSSWDWLIKTKAQAMRSSGNHIIGSKDSVWRKPTNC